jgi:hypothetical protein
MRVRAIFGVQNTGQPVFCTLYDANGAMIVGRSNAGIVEQPSGSGAYTTTFDDALLRGATVVWDIEGTQKMAFEDFPDTSILTADYDHAKDDIAGELANATYGLAHLNTQLESVYLSISSLSGTFGLVTEGDSTGLTSASAFGGSATNNYVGSLVGLLRSSGGIQEWRKVVANVGGAVTVDRAWTGTNPGMGDIVQVFYNASMAGAIANNRLTLTSDYDHAKDDVAGLIGIPSVLGVPTNLADLLGDPQNLGSPSFDFAWLTTKNAATAANVHAHDIDTRWDATKAGYLDAAITSRLATTGYTAPSNASIASILTVINKLDGMLALDGALYQFTVNALENGSADLTPMIAALHDFDPATDKVTLNETDTATLAFLYAHIRNQLVYTKALNGIVTVTLYAENGIDIIYTWNIDPTTGTRSPGA